MYDYAKVTYEIFEDGGALQLNSINAHKDFAKVLDQMFFDGELTKHVCLDDDGIYEMTLKVYYDNDEGYGEPYTFGMVQLVKVK